MQFAKIEDFGSDNIIIFFFFFLDNIIICVWKNSALVHVCAVW